MAGTGNAAHRVYSVAVFIVLASLDNVTITLVPPLYSPISRALGVGEGHIGLVTAVTFLVTAVAAVGWAYAGDRSNRKRVLMLGTVIWSVGAALTASAHGFAMFAGAQFVAAIGLGAVASVGFSVVSDLVAPRRRALVLSLWGLSQGVGTVAGTLVSSLLGGTDWRLPFELLAALGLAATVAYVFTYDIRRGQSEPELAGIAEYEHHITRADVLSRDGIVSRRTNVWLILQGLFAQATFGSLVWLPRLIQSRAQLQGFDEPTAIKVGGLLATLFQLGGVLSIVGGLVGDRWQRRDPGGRAKVAAIGILAGIPLYVVLFFLPIHIPVAAGAGSASVIGAVLKGVVTEPTLTVAFLSALVALALTSANSPNWFALIVDVNPPEQRGTVYSLGNLVNGVGRGAGNSLVAAVFHGLVGRFPPPANIAIGLAAFQVCFIPTGVLYLLAARTAPNDIETVRRLLRSRAAAAQPVSPATENDLSR